MDFSLTAEQELLRDTLAGYLAAHHDAAHHDPMRSRQGRRPGLWQAFAEQLGVLGAALPVSAGGSGGGPVETMVIAEQLGRALVAEPYVDTVVLGGGVLRRTGGPVADAALAGIVEGTVRVCPALLEAGSGHCAHAVSTTAVWVGTGWVLDGAKTMATGAAGATHLLLSARTTGGHRDTDGISLFLVPFSAAAPPPGLTVHPYPTIDGRDAADLDLDGLRLPADALLGDDGKGWPVLAAARDEALVAVAAEAVGSMRTVLADTVAFTTQRRQFGQPLSSFQVLAHRMADMHMEIEQAVSAVYLGTLRLDADERTRARAVAAAKVTVSRAARFVGQSAVQLHGGMGMSQDLAVGHHFTRLTAVEYEFGTADEHLARYGALSEEAST